MDIEYLKNLFIIFLRAIFTENLALYFFLGMCTFLAISKNIEAAVGLGVSVIAVQTITVPINNIIYNYLLKEGSLSWIIGGNNLDFSFLGVILYISSIAIVVQILEMILNKFFPTLSNSLGIFLPLITVNCAILGGSLFMIEKNLDFTESIAFGAGSGIGWALSIIILAGIRDRLKYSDVPERLADVGISFISAGILALAFMAGSGIL